MLLARAYLALGPESTPMARRALFSELSAVEAPTALALARLASLMMRNADEQGAVEILREALLRSPGSWEMRAALGQALLVTGRPEEAFRAFSAALALSVDHSPEYAPALRSLLDRAVAARARQTTSRASLPASTAPAIALDLARSPSLELAGVTEAVFDAQALGGSRIGFTSTAPIATVQIPEGAGPLYVHVVSEGDTTLFIAPATGSVRCDDDSAGNLMPGVFAELPAGEARIWVGSFEASAPLPFTLRIERGTHRPALSDFPTMCGDAERAETVGRVGVGARVVLQRHSPYTGTALGGGEMIESTDWARAMDAFVGREATIVSLERHDWAGCGVAHVDVDGGQWRWRVRDMQPAS